MSISGSLIDTGLGWYADGAWLSDSSGDIGEISRLRKPLPLPVSRDARKDGIYCYHTASSPYFSSYVSAFQDSVFGYAVVGSTYTNAWWISTEPFTFLEYSTKGGGTYITRPSSYDPINNVEVVTLSGNNGYFVASQYVFAVADYNQAISMFSGAVSSFLKSSSGYSVVCMCKWKTEIGGDVYCSPILISSEQNNTLYTRNDIDISNTALFTINNKIFYMRKDNEDILSGTETITSDVSMLDLSNEGTFTDEQLFLRVVSASGIIVKANFSLWSDPVIIGSSGGGGGSIVDTGLGWGANGNWLCNSAITLGSITENSLSGSSSSTPEYLPTTNTYVFYETLGYYDYYYRASVSDHIKLYSNGGLGATFWVVSDIPACYCEWEGIKNNVTYDSGSFNIDTLDLLSGLYYSILTISLTLIANVVPSTCIAVASSLQEALELYRPVSAFEFEKSNSGYSVTCMCKFRPGDSSTLYYSPVLISSVEANTAYTRNDIGIPNVESCKLGTTTFYIRKGTYDILDETKTITSNVLLFDLSDKGRFTDEQLFYYIAANANILLISGG